MVAPGLQAGGNAAQQGGAVPRRLPGLDLLRGTGVLLVVWFHFWQQTWLTPHNAVLARWVRYGFQFVDLLILLSAVCNFWPYARAMALGEPWPDTKTFYRRRAARILPSYFLSVAVFFCIALLEGAYTSAGQAAGDMLSYLTFTTAWSRRWLLWTRINVPLWTAQVELFYYLFMPFLARAFRRRPVWTCGGLFAAALGVRSAVLYRCPDQIRIYVNQPLSFAGHYAAGMLLCMAAIRLYGWLAEHPACARLQWLALPAAVLAVLGIDRSLRRLDGPDMQLLQLQQRPWLLLAFCALVLAMLCLPPGPARAARCAPVRFVCAISYNLYIWHQQLAVKCKLYRLPGWTGDTPPNQLYDAAWQWRYQAVIAAASLAVAVLVTYAWERPLRRRLLRGNTLPG